MQYHYLTLILTFATIYSYEEILIYQYNWAEGVYFDPTIKTTGLENPDDPSASTYSIIGSVNKEYFKGEDGRYEFRAIWGRDDGVSTYDVHWKQGSWITESVTADQMDYKPIDVPPEPGTESDTCAKFKGLGVSDSATKTWLDGNGASGCYWNSFAPFSKTGSSFVGFNRESAKSTQLYIIDRGISIRDFDRKKFVFGVKTEDRTGCNSALEHTMTLYYENKMYQCKFTPSEINTLYTCDSSQYIECDSSNALLSYGLQVDNEQAVDDNSCFVQIYIEIMSAIDDVVIDTVEYTSPYLFDLNVYRQHQYAALYSSFGGPHLWYYKPHSFTEWTSSAVCSPIQKYQSEIYYEFLFGFKTGGKFSCSNIMSNNECSCSSPYDHTITFYWGKKVFQCKVRPEQENTEYLCDSKGTQNAKYSECDPTKRTMKYGMKITNIHVGSCIDQVSVKVINSMNNEVVKDLVFDAKNSKLSGTKVFVLNPNIIASYRYNLEITDEVRGFWRDSIPICQPFFKVEIKSCEQQSEASSKFNTFQIKLNGNHGGSQFFYINKKNQLPVNGDSLSVFSDGIEYSKDIGDVYSVSIHVNDPIKWCIRELKIEISTKIYDFTPKSYFGSGLVLTNKGNCDYSYKSMAPDKPMIRCIDDFLELNAKARRGIFKLDVHVCDITNAGMTAANMKDLYTVIMGKRLPHKRYVSTSISYLNSSAGVNQNDDISYEINVAEYINDVTLISVGNINTDDNICIDSIFLDDDHAIYISDHWIGGASYIRSLNAIFKYPVCKTEVIGMTIDYDASTAHLLEGDAKISGLECTNMNKLISSTCSIEQTYEFSKTTSFSISNEDSDTKEYSWGSASSVSLGITESSSTTDISSKTDIESQTDIEGETDIESDSTMKGKNHVETTSNEVAWGFNQELTVGASVEVETGIAVAKASVTKSIDLSIGAHQDWTQASETSDEEFSETTIEETTERSKAQETTKGTEKTEGIEESTGRDETIERAGERNNQFTSSKTSTSQTESSWDTTEAMSITCSGEMEVPPSHSIKYSLIFNAIDTTVYTKTDIKLTLCSALLYPGTAYDPAHYVYIDDIPGVLTHKETTACIVQFDPAETLRNSIDCNQEQQLSLSAGSNYVPRCQKPDNKLYDGCQCDIGDSWTLAVCWCVDSKGNKLDGQMMHVEDGMTWQSVCVEKLQCADTTVKLPATVTVGGSQSCLEAQISAIAANDEYIPQCVGENPDELEYNPCQCKYGDVSFCWCVDEGGESMGDIMYVEKDTAWQPTCINLGCGAAIEIANKLPCVEQQRNAIEWGLSYVPTCHEESPSAYDGCQCKWSDVNVCWCVEEDGEPIEGKALQFKDGPSWQICGSFLACEESVYTANVAYWNKIYKIITVIATLSMAILVFMIYRKCVNNKSRKEYMRLKQVDSEYDEEDPLKIQD